MEGIAGVARWSVVFVFVREGEQTEEDCCSWTFQGGQAATRARRCEIEKRSIEPVM